MRILLFAAALAMAAPAFAPAFAVARPGVAAPAFTATDADGKTVRLDDFKGRTVVLEWTNAGCPYVRAHYDSGNMQATQAAARRASRAMSMAPAPRRNWRRTRRPLAPI